MLKRIKGKLTNVKKNKADVSSWIHCGECLDEYKAMKNPGVSPAEYQTTQAGWTKAGLQVWCWRHNRNVVNIDFNGENTVSIIE